MGRYLKYALPVLLAFTFADIHAQIKPGYVFGLNLSTMTMKTNGKSYHLKTPAGFHFGGSVELPVTENIALQPAFLFSAKGTSYKIDTIENSLSPVYIEIPVNVIFSFGSGALKVNLFTGTYFGIGIGGYKIDSGGNMKDINYGSGENNDLKPCDIGLNFGAGVNIRGLLICAQYGIGLVNISPESKSGTEMKNKVIGISLRATGQELRASFGR